MEILRNIRKLILLKIANIYLDKVSRSIECGRIDLAKKYQQIAKAYMLASNPNIFDDKEGSDE